MLAHHGWQAAKPATPDAETQGVPPLLPTPGGLGRGDGGLSGGDAGGLGGAGGARGASFGGEGGAPRVPQSVQSVPRAQRALADPGPPSSHSPLFGQKHVSVHIEVTGGAGGVLGWSSNEQVS